MTPREHIAAGMAYIRGRYGRKTATAKGLFNFLDERWYDKGGSLPGGCVTATNDTGQPEQISGP